MEEGRQIVTEHIPSLTKFTNIQHKLEAVQPNISDKD